MNTIDRGGKTFSTVLHRLRPFPFKIYSNEKPTIRLYDGMEAMFFQISQRTCEFATNESITHSRASQVVWRMGWGRGYGGGGTGRTGRVWGGGGGEGSREDVEGVEIL